jgi:hypothetical protein
MEKKAGILIILVVILGILVLGIMRSRKTLSIVTRIVPTSTKPTKINPEKYIFEKDDRISKRFLKMSIGDVKKLFKENSEVTRLMISPSGIFDWYDGRDLEITIQDGRIWGKPKNSVKGSPAVREDSVKFELKQYQSDGDIEVSNYVITPTERYYIRTLGSNPNNYKDVIPPCFDEIGGVSFYISRKGTITNLHYDSRSGVIVQLKGRKRVYIFPREQEAYFKMYPQTHRLYRRSMVDGKLNEKVVKSLDSRIHGFEAILEPGMWLYIPYGWLHYVETLDDETFSLIVRAK